MGTILKTNDLTKKYDKKVVVDNLSIEIEEGEIFGLLGPNGAGKSTTMNMICGIVRPTLGSVEFMGKDFVKNRRELINNLGYIPQELAIHGNLKAWENVELFTSLYGIKGAELKERIDESLEYVGLLEKRGDYAKTFSGGMKRRLNIACAIGHHPDLLIFDEPTVGIDAESVDRLLHIQHRGGNGVHLVPRNLPHVCGGKALHKDACLLGGGDDLRRDELADRAQVEPEGEADRELDF